MNELFTWVGIALLVAQSATFSGLNLAMFGVSALRLRTMAATGNKRAARLLEMRHDSNFLLTTILWGNVATNVLLTLLSGSVMTGAVAFFFSTFAITIGGEIVPQAYFSRHALRMASLLSPLLRFYQYLLYPLAKPSALALDAWLGKEGVAYIPERELEEALRQHVRAPESDIGAVEGTGAINFLLLDDLPAVQEGEVIDPDTVLHLPFRDGRPVFPRLEPSVDDPFLRKVQAPGKRWVVIEGGPDDPIHALDADNLLRAALFEPGPVSPERFCYRPVTIRDGRASLGTAIGKLKSTLDSDVIPRDLIIVWGDEKRVITGADLLGRLLQGIVRPGAA